MQAADLDTILDELRTIRTDHQDVEAKRARDALPASTHETLSAFANATGGTLVLGVDEADGDFGVTGLADPQQSQSDLQALCAQMEPPLRATIEVVDHPDGTVVIARIPAVPGAQRPCHLASLPAEHNSFIRVGDGDQRLTADEVRHLLGANVAADYSAAPAASAALLDGAPTIALLSAIRAGNRRAEDDDPGLLHRWRVADDGMRPTIAGLLTVGVDPQVLSAAARVTYRVLPRATDPPGTRHSGRHAEGTLGEILDDLLAWLRADLGQVHVVQDGQVLNRTPIPLEALREVLSNALVHRSFAPGLRDRSIVVEVSEDAVVVSSPGNLFAATDLEALGLSQMSGVRNTALVRIGEHLTTPSGARVVENQTQGICAADRACRGEGVMPPLFIDRPDSFHVLLPLGAIATERPHSLVASQKLSHADDSVRLLAVALRVHELRQQFPELVDVAFDASLAARALAPSTIVAAGARIDDLQEAGLLRRLTGRRRPTWVPTGFGPPVPSSNGARPHRPGSPDRILDLLTAVDAAASGTLGAAGIGAALGLSSPTSRNRWITRAKERGLIVPTKDNPFDPTGAYRLTDSGRRALRRSRS